MSWWEENATGGGNERDDIEGLLEDFGDELVGAFEVADDYDRLDVVEALDDVKVLGEVRLGRDGEVLELAEEELEEVLRVVLCISSRYVSSSFLAAL